MYSKTDVLNLQIQIKMKSDATITNYTETGVEFSDGSKLDADAIVFCTGFTNEVRNEAMKFVGPEIGEKLDDYWRLDSEGELRGAYKKQGCKWMFLCFVRIDHH